MVNQTTVPSSSDVIACAASGTCSAIYDSGHPSGTVARTTYTYDALNRLTAITYSDPNTAHPNYYYDESSVCSHSLSNYIGRMTHATISNSTAEEILSYDPMGRQATSWQVTPLLTCATGTIGAFFNNTFDQLGNIATSNIAAFILTSTYNRAGRLTELDSTYYDSTSIPQVLFSSPKYNAYGAPTEYVSGYSLASGVKTTHTFDTNGMGRLMTKNAVIVSSSTNVYAMTGPSSGNISYAPNGSLLGVTDGSDPAATSTYDDWNRLIGATKGSTNFTWDYDRYGNRCDQNGSGPGCDATNHESSLISRDAAGNITNDGVHSYTYDAENHLASVDGWSNVNYSYDAFGRRVEKTISGSSVDYRYDWAGHPISVFNTSAVIRNEVFAGSMHVGTYVVGTGSGTYYMANTNWLGTERTRLHYGSGAWGLAEDCTANPYGDSPSCATGTFGSISPNFYADYERDSESGLDHMWFRYYNPRIGRFMQADPYGGSADFSDPQSLNRFSYVRNNSINFIDPLGLETSGGGPLEFVEFMLGCAWFYHYEYVDGKYPGGGSVEQIIDSVVCQSSGGGGVSTDSGGGGGNNNCKSSNGAGASLGLYGSAGGFWGLGTPNTSAGGAVSVSAQVFNDPQNRKIQGAISATTGMIESNGVDSASGFAIGASAGITGTYHAPNAYVASGPSKTLMVAAAWALGLELTFSVSPNGVNSWSLGVAAGGKALGRTIMTSDTAVKGSLGGCKN